MLRSGSAVRHTSLTFFHQTFPDPEAFRCSGVVSAKPKIWQMFNFHRDSPSAVWHTALQPIRGTCLWCRTCDLHFGWRRRKEFSLRKDVLSQTKQTKNVAHCSSCNWVKRAAPSYAAGNWCRSVTWRVAKGARSQSVARDPDQSKPVFFPPASVLKFPFSRLTRWFKNRAAKRLVSVKMPARWGPPPFFIFFSI